MFAGCPEPLRGWTEASLTENAGAGPVVPSLGTHHLDVASVDMLIASDGKIDALAAGVLEKNLRRRGRGGKGATAASAAAVVIQSLSQPTAPAAAGSSVSGGVSAPGERGCGAGHRLESKVADVEEFLRSVRCAATQARPSAQRGIFSRGIGQSVASLKDAARLESRRAARRAQDKRVTKVRAAREAKQWRRHHSRQHNQGRSADGSFHRGAKRKRGNGKNHDADRRAAQSRGYRR
jgi:hypothetical protein